MLLNGVFAVLWQSHHSSTAACAEPVSPMGSFAPLSFRSLLHGEQRLFYNVICSSSTTGGGMNESRNDFSIKKGVKNDAGI
jgi:hypothetical protein